MLVKDVMSKDLTFVRPDASVIQVARLMREADVGAIPVVDDPKTRRVMGVVTDRDIAVRIVAVEKDPNAVKAEEVMSRDLVTIRPAEDLERAAKLMQENHVRRLPVVDEKGSLVGMLAQGDIARSAGAETVKETVARISQPKKKTAV